jgi:hypothetical protein
MSAAFKLDPAPTFQATARLSFPGGGEGALPITWRHLGRAAMRAWIERVGAGGEVDALLSVIEDWKVVDADGTPLAFDRAALERLLDAYPASAAELCRTYVEALTASRLGN